MDTWTKTNSMLSMIALPTWSDIETGTTDYAQGFFSEFLPWILIAIGVALGVGLIIFLINVFSHVGEKLSGEHRRSSVDDKNWNRELYFFHKTGHWPR